MVLRKLIAIFFIAVYAIVFSHDFIPHHHHTNECASTHHNTSNQSEDCKFPFHQHNLDEAGLILNNSGVFISFDIHNLSPKEIFNYADVIEYENDKLFVDLIQPVYKGPDLTSISHRGPPLS